MKGHSSLLLGVLLVAALSLGAWFAFSEEDAPIGTAEIGVRDREERTLREPSQLAELAELAKLGSSGARESLLRENFPLQGARILKGKVVLPEGASFDPTMEVVAIALGNRSISLQGDLVSMGLRGSSPDAPTARRLVSEDLTFQVPVPSDADMVALHIDGKLLRLREPEFLRGEDLSTQIVLEPELGAYVTVQLTPPADAPDSDLDDTEVILVTDSGNQPDLVLEGNIERRFAAPDESGLVEFRGVRATSRLQLTSTRSMFASASLYKERLTPGESYELELVLSWGATLTGRVEDEAGEPIRGAWVNLSHSSESDQEAFKAGLIERVRRPFVGTDGNGRFVLEGLELEDWTLGVKADGFLPYLRPGHEFTTEKESREILVVLATGPILSGVVLWPDGTPAVDCSVNAVPSDAEEPEPEDHFSYRASNNTDAVRTRTDEQGRFRLANLEAGASELRASATPPSLGEEPEPRPWDACLRDVQADTHDIQLVLAAPSHLTGRLVDNFGAPIQKPFLLRAVPTDRLSQGIGGKTSKYFKSPLGQFELTGLRAGAWKIDAEVEGYVSNPELTVHVDVPQEGEVELVLMRGCSIAGYVLDSAGSPVTEARIFASSDLGRRQRNPQSALPRTEDDGAFEIDGLDPGKVELKAVHPISGESKPVVVDLAPGQQRRNVTLTMQAGGTLRGQAFEADGSIAAGRHIDIHSLKRERSLLDREATTDENGEFEVQHLAPGPYGVVMVQPRVQGAKDADDVDHAIASVSIFDNEITTVRLGAKSRNPVVVQGRVSFANGDPGKGDLVAFAGSGDMMASYKKSAIDEEGKFELELNNPGPHIFMIQNYAESFPRVDFHESIPALPNYVLNLEIPGGKVAGRVTRPGGKPASKVPVLLSRSDGRFSIDEIEGGRDAVTDESGRFNFVNVSPGTFSLRAGGEVGSFGYAVLPELQLAAGDTLTGIELHLALAGSIEGLVRDEDDKPVKSARIFVRDDNGNLASNPSATTTNLSGEFTRGGLPAGTYTVTAVTGDKVSKPVSVSIREGEASEAKLKLRAGTVVHIHSGDDSNAPGIFRLTVRNEAGHEFANMMTDNATERLLLQGFFGTTRTIGPLAPGEYSIVAATHDGREVRTKMRLKGEAAKRVELDFR